MSFRHISMFLIGASLGLYLGVSSASTASGAPGVMWMHGNASVVAFEMANRVNRPSCASYGGISGQGRFAVDLSTNQGRGMYAYLIAAKTMGQSINVVGTGTCTIFGDSEDVSYIYSN